MLLPLCVSLYCLVASGGKLSARVKTYHHAQLKSICKGFFAPQLSFFLHSSPSGTGIALVVSHRC